MSSLDFTGRVAVITGAGRGIGRAHAELLAARGAKVIVNDIGGSMSDARSDGNAGPAQEVTESIAQAGGTAEPSTCDISTPEGADELISQAVSSFGRVDIVVSNAGIYTLDEFPDLDLEMMRRHFDVHIGGSFNVTRAAWQHMARAGYGRVVLTTSSAALGNDKMVAYGAAKAGVIGLGRALAQVGLSSGIKVNVVAPMANTRMMGFGMGLGEVVPPPAPDRDPSLVSPLVAVLCHESCPTTGETYASGMRRSSRLFVADSQGYTHPGLDLTPEVVRDHWDLIVDPDDSHIATDTMDWSAVNQRRIAAT